MKEIGMPGNMGDLLKEWREVKKFSKYAIAKYENCRIEVVTAVEEGRATMTGLCFYLDFIGNHDAAFLQSFISTWWVSNGYRSLEKLASENLAVSEK